MAQPYYEVFREVNELGIRLAYNTVPGGYRPLHWHEAIEILIPIQRPICLYVSRYQRN